MISIDLLNDLKDKSHLKALLNKSQIGVLSLAVDIAQFGSQAVRCAVGSKPAKITISKTTNWTTSSGIGFSLTPAASCTICIAATSTKLLVAKSIQSIETQDIVSGPVTGKVYVNIDLDFVIAGSLAASGAVSGIGIAGKASGSAGATLSYCHAVDAETNTVDAIREAFSTLVFPFEPDCALTMAVGDAARVNFDGSLGFGIDVTYGLGSYKFSAPGVASVQQSLQSAADKLTLSDVDLAAGAKVSFSYKHADHFTAIIQKLDPNTAKLYTLRSATNEFGETAGITVGISVTPVTVSVDAAALAVAVNRVTGSGGEKAGALADQLQTSLAARTAKWLSNEVGDAGLMVSLSRQTNSALLYVFQADLSNPEATRRSWEQLAQGDIASAAEMGSGLTMLPGSGVGWELKRSVSIGLHFFNFFSESDTGIYFQKSRTELGPDGSIRFLYDIGKEADSKTKDTLRTSRIHFVASANPAGDNAIRSAAVDLCIELSETKRVADGNLTALVIHSLPSERVQTAETAMRDFTGQHPEGKLSLLITLKASAYQRLTCSTYTGARHEDPAPPPQAQDRANWNAYVDAARLLMNLNYIADLKWEDWELFNQYSVYGEPKGTPNRRAAGNPLAVPAGFYAARNVSDRALLVSYFFLSAARFMNLCEDLSTLAGSMAAVDTLQAWDSLLDNLTVLAKDLDSDWSRAAARALLQLCGQVAMVQADLTPDGARVSPSLTCTVTVS